MLKSKPVFALQFYGMHNYSHAHHLFHVSFIPCTQCLQDIFVDIGHAICLQVILLLASCITLHTCK